MTAKLISGNEIAKQIREELKQEVAKLKAEHNVVPARHHSRWREPGLGQLRHGETEDLQRAGLLLHPGQPA